MSLTQVRHCWCFMICWSLLVIVGYLCIDLTSSWSVLTYPSLTVVEFSELPTDRGNTSGNLTKKTQLWIQPQRDTLVSYIFSYL